MNQKSKQGSSGTVVIWGRKSIKCKTPKKPIALSPTFIATRTTTSRWRNVLLARTDSEGKLIWRGRYGAWDQN
ncbi:hypothetical protein BKG89_00460 [Rodentibacter caecimuris]|uniref:Uncharacterized protein n=1 Tax=Rodentibacter caecimuris TaxID=1796644 RepID=A0ABX3L122_9PAST|nr:hypothetical protein BKG89_00460 [Rodentibacter heylii]